MGIRTSVLSLGQGGEEETEIRLVGCHQISIYQGGCSQGAGCNG